MQNKEMLRKKRHKRMRQTLSGTAQQPRLNVFRSLNHIYAQIIDDTKGATLVAASTNDKELRAGIKAGGNTEAAKVVGKSIGERARKAGIETVVFDRGGYKYHGRVAALADGAREAGLKF